MQPEIRRVVIFESDPRGHAREWLTHILKAAERQGLRNRMVLLVARELADVLPVPLTGGADVVALSEGEQRLCNTGSAFQRGMAKWRVVRRLARRIGVDGVFFLSLDHLLAPLALGCGLGKNTSVSGILFRPTAHYDAFEGGTGGAGVWLKQRIKRDFVVRALRNPALSTLMSLDPYFPDYAQRHLPGGGKVVPIDDPAPTMPALAPKAGGTRKTGRTAFLLFGEITERKGALQLLQALHQAPVSLLRQIEVSIAGRIDSGIEERFYRLLRELEWGRPDAMVHVEDRWASDAELADRLTRTDIVLAPYQNFVGSSGVLIRAAQYRKPVICQRFGLLGQLVRDFELGIATDTSDPSRLAQAMEIAAEDRLQGTACVARFQDFLNNREAETFGNRVLEAAFSGNHNTTRRLPSLNADGLVEPEKMVTGVPRLVTRMAGRLVK
ncbi:MAG: glycosyltransferase [Pseudomonadota bacterium]|nr:glycosyltransferase [Pseudomonadota bacterium]